MTSRAQRDANAANGRLSKGPVSAEGKRRSAKNATVHGIYRKGSGSVDVGPFAEDAELVRAVITQVEEKLQPADDLERLCVQTIAQCYLDLARVDQYKIALLANDERAGDGTLPPSARLADDRQVALVGLERILERSIRLKGRVFAQINTAVAQLDALRARTDDDDEELDQDLTPIEWYESSIEHSKRAIAELRAAEKRANAKQRKAERDRHAVQLMLDEDAELERDRLGPDFDEA